MGLAASPHWKRNIFFTGLHSRMQEVRRGRYADSSRQHAQLTRGHQLAYKMLRNKAVHVLEHLQDSSHCLRRHSLQQSLHKRHLCMGLRQPFCVGVSSPLGMPSSSARSIWLYALLPSSLVWGFL